MDITGYFIQFYTILESLGHVSLRAWGGRGNGGFGWWGCPVLNSGSGWPGIILYYAFWGLVIVLLITFVRRVFLSRRTERTENADSSHALEILKQRYAKGEISDEDFERMKAALT